MIAGMTAMTTIKVPVPVRDRLVLARADHDDPTQAVTLERALDALEREEIFAELAAWTPDEEYLAEAREWDRADFGTILG